MPGVTVSADILAAAQLYAALHPEQIGTYPIGKSPPFPLGTRIRFAIGQGLPDTDPYIVIDVIEGRGDTASIKYIPDRWTSLIPADPDQP